MKLLSRILILLLSVISADRFTFAQSVTFSLDSEELVCSFIPSDQGKPQLKSASRYIAIPKDAEYQITIDSKTENVVNDVYVAPAYRLSNDLDPVENQALEDSTVYNNNAFYPNDIITCQRFPLRDFDLLLVKVAMERYNPVGRQLKTIENAKVSCHINRLRQPKPSQTGNSFFKSLVINPEFFESTADVNYDGRYVRGCDYLIITPDDTVIEAWADSLRHFRNAQGIITKVMPISDACYNAADSLKTFLQYVYNEWVPSPAAVLLLGDYSSDPAKGITTFALTDHPDGHHYEPYMADNKLVDFNNDDLPDVVIARMPAADGQEAALMVGKTLQYERQPYTDWEYYAHPTTAMGFQLKRWFQLCTEIVAGYYESHGKQGVHLNAIHQGTPDTLWSSGQNTGAVLQYFGPDGLGYIPSTMTHLTHWNANASTVTQALEDGSFILLHRDHGTFQSWGEPEYNNWFVNQLDNDKLTFVVSANCQTGDFSYGYGENDCLAERFLRIPHGAVGVVAASQLSYSYVNDTYVWGLFDYLNPDFMPDYGGDDIDFQYPAFANAYGKYFLWQSSFPSNGSLKALTNNLFHYFGDAYLQLYSEVPQHIAIHHPASVLHGATRVAVTADEGAMVALSVNDNLIARRKSNGNEMIMRFTDPVEEGTVIKVVATKQNHFRHESHITVGTGIGVDEVSDNPIILYPNPTTGRLHVEGEGISEVRVINVLGKTTKIYPIDSDSDINDIDCSDLPNGMYFIKVSGRNTVVGKIVKR